MRLDCLLAEIGLDDDRALGVEVAGLTLDSRQVVDGTLFVAIQGSAGHGMDYIDAAITSGASAVIYDGWDGPVPNMIPALHIPGLASDWTHYMHLRKPRCALWSDGYQWKTTTVLHCATGVILV